MPSTALGYIVMGISLPSRAQLSILREIENEMLVEMASFVLFLSAPAVLLMPSRGARVLSPRVWRCIHI